jgi:hypothetical protein
MTEEIHKITITIQDVDVNLRTNGDGFEYAKVKDMLRVIMQNVLAMTSDTLIPRYGKIGLDDERIA